MKKLMNKAVKKLKSNNVFLQIFTFCIMVFLMGDTAFATNAIDQSMGGLVNVILSVVLWMGVISLIIGAIFFFKNMDDSNSQTKYTSMMIFGVVAIIGKVVIQVLLDAIGSGITL